MHCSGIVDGLLCRTIRGYQQDMITFWASISGCLTRLTIDVPVKHLSACCTSLSSLVALQQLELTYADLSRSEQLTNIIAISLPNRTCLSLPRWRLDIALDLDNPKLQTFKLGDMHRNLRLNGSTPNLRHLVLRDNPLPLQGSSRSCLDNIVDTNGQPRLACGSKLSSLELQYECDSPERLARYGMEELSRFTNLTRLVTWVRSADLSSLPKSLRNLMIVGCQVDVTAVAQRLASECAWRLESLDMIAPVRDWKGQLYNPNTDTPWGMRNLRQWHCKRNSDGVVPCSVNWMREVLKEVDKEKAALKRTWLTIDKIRLMLTYTRYP